MSVDSIIELPSYLKEVIFSYLPNSDLYHLFLTCKDFKQTLENSEHFWESRSIREFSSIPWKTIYIYSLQNRKNDATNRLTNLIIETSNMRFFPSVFSNVDTQEIDQLIQLGANLHQQVTFQGERRPIYNILIRCDIKRWFLNFRRSHPITTLLNRMVIADPKIILCPSFEREESLFWKTLIMPLCVEAVKAIFLNLNVDIENFKEIYPSRYPNFHPLTIAISMNNLELVKFYIENQIFKPTDKDKSPHDNVELARLLNFTQIENYLIQALKDVAKNANQN